MSTPAAVVFAYHDVGVRCLRTLLSAGVRVPLVVTVADDPAEQQWFASVAATAAAYNIPVSMPEEAGDGLEQRVAALQPDFIFSFYYRSLLSSSLLRSARRGALNIHGSLLPKYRGRAPVNWAILRGERETGATLHYMVEQADAGDIVDQLAVPILADDTAREVFAKVTVAAEVILARSLPALLAGTAARHPQPLQSGQYFGRRRPEDGRIDWTQPAQQIHDLVRAVAPPFPGAFTEVCGQRWCINRTSIELDVQLAPGSDASAAGGARARLTASSGKCYVRCIDGRVLRLLSVSTIEGPLDLEQAAAELERNPLMLS